MLLQQRDSVVNLFLGTLACRRRAFEKVYQPLWRVSAQLASIQLVCRSEHSRQALAHAEVGAGPYESLGQRLYGSIVLVPERLVHSHYGCRGDRLCHEVAENRGCETRTHHRLGPLRDLAHWRRVQGGLAYVAERLCPLRVATFQERLLASRGEQAHRCAHKPLRERRFRECRVDFLPACIGDGRVHAVILRTVDNLLCLVPCTLAVLIHDACLPAFAGSLVLLPSEVIVEELLRRAYLVVVFLTIGVPGSLCYPLQRVHCRRGLDELVQLEGAIISLPFMGIPQQLRIIGDDFLIGVPDRFRLDILKPVKLVLRECLA